MNITEIIKKIDNKETLSEKEIKTLIWESEKEVDEIEGEDRRWSRSIQTIVQNGNRYFSIFWEKGLTEMQEDEYYEQPYEVELEEYEKTIIVKEWKKK